MRLRLGAYLTGIFIVCVLVLPFSTSHHNPRASHIDMAQELCQTSHEKKYKKHVQNFGFLSPPLRLISRAYALINSEHDYSLTTYAAAAVGISCRAPPVLEAG